MNRKTLAAASFVAASLFTGASFAQTTLTEVAEEVNVPAFNMTADQVEDMDVYDSEGMKVGEVEEVIGSDQQTPTHLEIEFEDDDGGQYADRDDVLVPLESVSYGNDRLTINLTPDEVTALPNRDDDD